MTGNIDYFTTSSGSIYKMLPDGRYKRFKSYDDGHMEPREPFEMTVFIPSYEWAKNGNPQKTEKLFGNNASEYERNLDNYINAGKTPLVLNNGGNELNSNFQVKTEKDLRKNVCIAFRNRDRQVLFTMPVSALPQIGWYPFESDPKFECDGQWFRISHMGDTVVKIVEK